MKSIIIFYLLFICTFFVPSTFSYPSRMARLYNLLQKPLHPEMDSSLLTKQTDKDASTTASYQESNSVEDKDNNQRRNDWNSGEHYYFKWANKNRRPVEYFIGRKRETNKMVIPPRARRINGGLWRSGLVGKRSEQDAFYKETTS